jgi:hypothetical protein
MNKDILPCNMPSSIHYFLLTETQHFSHKKASVGKLKLKKFPLYDLSKKIKTKKTFPPKKLRLRKVALMFQNLNEI